MANNGNDDASYEPTLVQDQYHGDTGRRLCTNRFEEDVRRFACDRCRSQKLRCERDRLSLNTALKSTPCRRCIKARVRCTTSTQARIGRSLDDSNAKPQRRQTTRSRRTSAFDARPDDFFCSDEDEISGQASTEAAMPNTHSQQYRTENTMINPPDRVLPSPTSLPGTVVSKLGSTRMQESDGSLRSVIDPNLLHETLPAPPHSKSTTPNKAKPMAAQNHTHSNNQQLQYEYIDFPDQMSSGARDVQFVEGLNSIIEHTFDSPNGVNWVDTSLINGTNSDTLDQENDFAVGNLDSHQGIAHYGSSEASSAPLANNRQTALPSDSYRVFGETAFENPHSKPKEAGDPHAGLTGRLTELTGILLKTLDLDSNDTSSTVYQADKSESRKSPMSKLFWNVEQFLGILSEVSNGIQALCPSARDNFDVVVTSLRVNGHNRTHSAGINRPHASKATPLPSCGLPGLTTMMAVFTTYSCVLQAYERVFDDMHQSLIRAGPTDNAFLTLLPLIQLDSVKFAVQNSLQVHIAMEVSLQMLNQSENKISFLVSAYKSSCDETKACLLALLQSLNYNEGGDSISASAMIRETINGVRKLLISEDNNFCMKI